MSPKTTRLADERQAARAGRAEPEPAGPAPPSLEALELLEAIDRAPQEATARAVEGLRARLRALHQPVPAVIEQLRGQEPVYGPELRRLHALPWVEFSVRLGASQSLGPLRTKVADTLAVFAGRAYEDFTVPSVVAQLGGLAGKIERIGLTDTTLAAEIAAECAAAEAWPALVVTRMQEIRELSGRLGRALQIRGGVTVRPSGIDPAPPPTRAAPGGRAEIDFDPLRA